jgi:hypothetical protein
MPYQFSKTVCVRCSCLALARWNGIPLCAQCLVNCTIASCGEDITEITPLLLCSREETEPFNVVYEERV